MRVFLLSHSTGLKGPVNYLEEYLLREKYDVLFLEHPLDSYKNKYSLLFDNKKTTVSLKRNSEGFVNLFADFFISIFYAYKSKYEIFIGGNNFDTIPGIILRMLGIKKIKKIVYFSTDFSEDRYKNFLMNIIYRQVESFVIRYADITVSNTKRAEEKRILLGLDQAKSVVIPNGIHLDHPIFFKKTIKKDEFIYIGNVTQEHGIFDFVVEIKPLIKKLVVIGQGDQWDSLINFCKDNNIKSEFFYKKTHEETIAYLQHFSGFGLAPYTLHSLWTRYSSPLKVNEYIACGVPVIMSDIPEIYSYVYKKKLGIVYDELKVNRIKSKIEEFNAELFEERSKLFYKKYNYDLIYNSLL